MSGHLADELLIFAEDSEHQEIPDQLQLLRREVQPASIVRPFGWPMPISLHKGEIPRVTIKYPIDIVMSL